MSYLKYRNQPSYSPMGKWLIEYIDREKISLTRLAQSAGLATGTLRYLVTEPDRIPTLETCAKLAEATDTKLSTLLEIAELSHKAISYSPQRESLISLYDELPIKLRGTLVSVAESLSASLDKDIVQIRTGADHG
jgi:hypothetical protein